LAVLSRSSETAEQTVPDASVVITTRNRCDEVLVAVESCFAQDCKVEVLVYDDCSDDGTAVAVKSAFPETRVVTFPGRVGYIVNRNRGFRDARAPVVFSLDDDAYFSEPDIVSRTLDMFDRDPSVAAVAIPYIEPLKRLSLSSLRYSRKSLDPGADIRSYIGCAHAIRIDAALAAGGYRDFFVHQHEERDLCLRLRDAGGRVVYGDSAPIVHMVSPKRSSARVMLYGGRNQILCETLNVPFPDLLVRLVRVPIGMISYRFQWSTLPIKLQSLGAGLMETVRRWHERKPVRRATFRAYRALPGHGPEPWEGEVPPPCGEAPAATGREETA